MDRRTAFVGLAAFGPVLSTRARAQAVRNARVAWVTIARADPDSPFLQGFRGLRAGCPPDGGSDA